MTIERIVLAYSGGFDTSVAIPWLAETYGSEVVTVTVDVGQGRALDDARERALAIGAARAHVVDGREEFARDFLLPALAAGALYEGRYPLATALGRPLLAKHLVEIAHIEGAVAIAHGCHGRDNHNDQVRLDLAVRALDPSITMLAPARESGFTPSEKVRYAERHGIPVPPGHDRYTVDVNLWGRSVAGGGLNQHWAEPPDDAYAITRAPADAPDLPAYVEIAFEGGVPSATNGVALSPVELITHLETIAGVHGVGRIDMVENHVVGVKARELYEAPAAVLLHTAHAELQKFVVPRDLERLLTDLGIRYADLVYNGQWFTPTRAAIDALVANVQQRVTGVIRLKLFKGQCHVVGRQSPFAFSEPDPEVAGAAVKE